MPGRPVDSQTRAGIIEAARSGKTRNQIAREFKVAGSTVTRICADEGIEFDRSKTELAVRAHQIDLAEARLELARKMVLTAHDALEDLGAPYTVFNFGGKDNTFESETLDGPPEEVRRSIMTTAGIAFDKATRILERDNGGLDDAVGVIDNLAANLHAAAELLRAEDSTDADAAGE